MKQPYFTTADGMAVEYNDDVYCVVKSDSGKWIWYYDWARWAKDTVSHDHIFSTRAAAQAECDKLNKR